MLKFKVNIVFFLIFVASSRAIILNCEYVMVSWTLIGDFYTCLSSQVIQSRNETSLTEVRGRHITGRTDENVHGFTLRNSFVLNQIPKNVEAFFPNLIAIEYHGGNLTSVSADDIKPFPNLKLLSLSSQQLVTLDGDLFKHTPKIQAIFFRDNFITNVGHNFLSDLNDLIVADFRHNPCVHFFANSFTQIENLKTMLLRQCPPLKTPEPPTTISTTSTTTSGECSIRCTIDEETDELKAKVDALTEANEKYEERFVELERRIRELSSNPCTPRLCY